MKTAFLWPGVFLLIVAHHTWGQPGYLPVKHFTEEANLVTNGVNEQQSIVQDTFGFIWLGTESGLMRYDGYRFLEYQPDKENPMAVRSSYVTELLASEDGGVWVGTDKGLDLYLPSINGFLHVDLSGGRQHPLLGPKIVSLAYDSAKTLWVVCKEKLFAVTRSGGDFRVSDHTSIIRSRIPGDDLDLRAVVEYGKKGEIFVATHRSGLVSYQPETGKVELLVDILFSPVLNTLVITGLFREPDGSIWIGTTNGMLQYNAEAKKFREVPELRSLTISDVAFGNDRILHIASSGGLFFFNPESKVMSTYRSGIAKPYTTIRDEIQTVFIDNQRNLWIGTRGHGIDKLSRKTKDFNEFQSYDLPARIVLNDITSIHGLDAEHYLFGTRSGLFKFNKKRPDFTELNVNSELISQGFITAMTCDTSNRIWVAISGQGLIVLDDDGQEIKRIGRIDHPKMHRSLHSVWTLETDMNGFVWAGTDKGIVVINPDNTSDISVIQGDSAASDLGDFKVRTIIRDSNGKMWIGSNHGLGYWNTFTRKIEGVTFDNQRTGGLPGYEGEIGFIAESKRNSLWLGTLEGIYEYVPGSNSVQRLGFPDRLQSSMVSAMLSDMEGNLWLATMTGIWKYEVSRGAFSQYSGSDGLSGMPFTSACYRDRQGNLLFGGEDGFLLFHPDHIEQNEYIPPVYITELQLFHAPVDKETEDKGELTRSAVHLSDKITLHHWQNVITLRFSALNYTSNEKNSYAYKLEGFDQDWHYVGTKNEAIYTNLDPGVYTFRVKGSNNDGVWNEQPAELVLEILPPWWKSRLALLCYAVMLFGGAYSFHRFQVRRLELKHKLRLEKQESAKLKELDESKSMLYANITHEFRTPLTIISGMASDIRATSGNDIAEHAMVIERQSKSLLNLVNQMLDLSKLDAGKLELHLVHDDIIHYTRYILESFRPYANMQRIQMHFLANRSSYLMDYDPDKYLQVLSNLVANALKFSPEGGNIYLSANIEQGGSDERFVLKVRDTGIGIGGDVQQVFNRYYQEGYVEGKGIPGTGIGLSLTKDLVLLFGGDISVSSNKGQGTEFVISLPVGHSAAGKTQESVPDIEKVTEPFEADILAEQPMPLDRDEDDQIDDRPSVLVIEDNSEIANYIKRSLGTEYEVRVVDNGQLGLDTATDRIPDLILLDLMMPDKDGFEVIRELKSNSHTDHIPIIVLTALADRDTKLNVLRLGVDDFMVKPFDKDELLLRIGNSLKIRNTSHCKYASAESRNTYYNREGKMEEDPFIVKLKQVVEDHLDNEAFGIPQVCRELRMSRTQLHNKVKALTGRSTSRFLRLVRLQKAKELLIQPDLNVSQVAYDVGFRDPNYFSRCFAEEFGFPPSQYSKS